MSGGGESTGGGGGGVPPAVRVVRNDLVPHFDTVPVFNIRNGTPEGASSLLIKATIASWSHWVDIDNMPAQAALRFIDAYYACYYVRMLNANHGTDANRRKLAICLATARAVTKAYYLITPADLIAGETAPPMMRYEPAGEAGQAERVVMVEGLTGADATAIGAVPQMTNEDKAAVTVLLRCCIGIVPMQGYSLLTQQHHYLSDAGNPSRKAFAAVEKQFWKDGSIKDWIADSLQDYQDVLWHKSCHPIRMNIKMAAATSEFVKEQLITAGAGSAAARLPALEADARAGSSYLALFDVVKTVYKMYDGDVDASILELALETVNRYPPGEENPGEMQNRDPRIPAAVVNRRTAVAWVNQIVKRNAPAAAQCFGFYVAMSERSSGGTGDTLRNSYALKKLQTTNLPSYMTGYEQCGDYNAARNKQRTKGIFIAPIFEIK